MNSPRTDRHSAGQLIEAFLDAHPRGELFVAVGYASVAGIAWLAERTGGRPVTLLIGNTQRSQFKNPSAQDRDAAIRFLQRDDVTVLNWYQKGRDGRPSREAHLKVWAVMSGAAQRSGPPGSVEAILVGSGNLTKAGLLYNEEAFAHAAGQDLNRLGVQLQQLRQKAWDRTWDRQHLWKDKILEYITPSDAASPAATRPGCLASLLPARAIAAFLVIVHASRAARRAERRVRSSPRSIPE